MACSALKRAYRDILRSHAPDVLFIQLDADPERIVAQVANRRGHFMPRALLQSQLEALEPLDDDEVGIVVVVNAPPEEIVARVRVDLAAAHNYSRAVRGPESTSAVPGDCQFGALDSED